MMFKSKWRTIAQSLKNTDKADKTFESGTFGGSVSSNRYVVALNVYSKVIGGSMHWVLTNDDAEYLRPLTNLPIYTADELMCIVSEQWSNERIKSIHEAKRALGGTILTRTSKRKRLTLSLKDTKS